MNTVPHSVPGVAAGDTDSSSSCALQSVLGHENNKDSRLLWMGSSDCLISIGFSQVWSSLGKWLWHYWDVPVLLPAALCWGPGCFLGVLSPVKAGASLALLGMEGEVELRGWPDIPSAHQHRVCAPADAGAGGEAVGHAAIQRGTAHHGTGHLTWVGTRTHRGVGGWAVGVPWSETCGSTVVEWEVAPTAHVHKVGDKAGDSMATSSAPFGWDGRAVAVLGMHRGVPSSAGIGWVLCGAVVGGYTAGDSTGMSEVAVGWGGA